MRLVPFLFLLACGTDTEAPPVEEESATPALPEAPALPVFDCPEGWAAAEANGVGVCDPYPDGVASCLPYEVHLPGEAGCRMVGPECPSGVWPENLPSSGVWHVQPEATGDGSIDDPFGTLAEAVEAAAPGDTIALSKGTHHTMVSVDKPLDFVGACAAQTQLVGQGSVDPTLTLTADGSLSGMTVSGREGSALSVQDAAVELDGVAVEGFTVSGVSSTGGSLMIHDFACSSDVVPDEVRDGTCVAGGNAEVTIDRAHIRDVALTAVQVVGGSLTAHSLAVVGSGYLGVAGVESEMSIHEVYLEDTGVNGLAVQQSSAVVSDLVVTGASGVPAPESLDGFGILQLSGALELDRYWAYGNHAGALTMHLLQGTDEEPLATVRDLVVQTSRQVDLIPASVLLNRGELTLERASISTEGNPIFTLGGNLSVVDATLVHEPTDPSFLYPVVHIYETELSLERVSMEATGLALELLYVNESEVELADVSLKSASAGQGISITKGGSLLGERVAIYDTSGFAMLVRGVAELLDLTIENVAGPDAAGVQLGKAGEAHITNYQVSGVDGVEFDDEVGTLELH